MDFAELVLTARTDGLKRGETALDQLADEAERTERRTGKATDGMSSQFTRAGTMIAKAASGAVVALVSFQQAAQAIQQARGFQGALAETSTLIEGTAAEMDFLSDRARAMAKEFGTDATQQVNAFYQAISAGADGVQGAAEVLEAANKLAVGGVTSVTTGVDALTTAVNAYAADGLTAAEASDAMFVAMRAGKTTISELSANLGQIVPISAAAGVSFDEVTAAIAALTTQGLSTSAATTGLRAILSAVIAPTSQAADAADALGIAFNAQALEAQGLAGFLQGIITAANGDKAALADLFGSVEALNAVLSMAGGGGEKFSKILLDMTDKAGATDAAFEKMADSLDQRWSRATAAATDLALGFGNAALTVIVPALEAAAGAMEVVVENADFFIASLGLLAASKIPAVVSGLMTLVVWTQTAEAAFIAGAVAARAQAAAMMLLPWGAAALGATAVYRAFRDSAQAADSLRTALDGLATAQDTLNTATTRYYEDVTQANLDAMKTAAQRQVQEVKDALAAAREVLSNETGSYGFIDSLNPFTSSASQAKRLMEAKQAVSDLEAALIEAEARLSAVDNSQQNYNNRNKETKDVVDQAAGSLDDLKKAAKDLDGSFSGASKFGDNLAYLSEQIEVLGRAQRSIKAHETGAAIEATLAEAGKLAGKMGLAADEASQLRRMLGEISSDDPFGDQAVALARVVDFIDASTGGLSAMNTEAYGVYESLLQALNTAISMSQQDYTSAINAAGKSAAFLAQQFGISYKYARALSQMQVNTTKMTFGGAVPSGGVGGTLGSGFGQAGQPLTLRLPSVNVPPLEDKDPPSVSGGGGQSKQNDLMEEGKRLTQALRTEQERFNDALAQADRLLEAGAIDLETYNRHVAQLEDEYKDISFENVLNGIESISDALVDAIVAGDNLKDVFKNILVQMAKDALSSGLKAILTDQLTPGSGGGGSFLGAIFGGLFGGARAGGGDVEAGRAYEVGENGREWFVPTQDGTILPHGMSPNGGMQSQGSKGASILDQLNVNVTMDESTAVLGSFVTDQAGRVLASQEPRLIAGSVKAARFNMKQSKAGWGL